MSFAKNVHSLVTVIEELGNPFEEESQDLLLLDTKEIANPTERETVRNAKRIGHEQFNTFTNIDETKSTDIAIHHNKPPLFGTSTYTASRGKKELTSLKNDVTLAARRDGNLEEFFQHENQVWPPTPFDAGRLHLGTKSVLLECLESIFEAKSKAPSVTNVLLDGVAIVHMLKPGAAKTFEEHTQ